MLCISFNADPLTIPFWCIVDGKEGKNWNNLHPFVSHYASKKDNQWISDKIYIDRLNIAVFPSVQTITLFKAANLDTSLYHESLNLWRRKHFADVSIN